MEEYFATIPLGNSSVLCVGGITRAETKHANEDGLAVDGLGYYLFVASEAEPKRPVEVLAKLASNSAAEKLARLFGVRAALA